MVKILAIGDPHGAIDKIKKIPIKNIDLILCSGDLGNANLARKLFFENMDRQKQGLKKKEASNLLRKRMYMESYKSSIKVIKYLAKYVPVYLIYGNADYNNSDVKKISKKIGYDLPFMTNDLKKIEGVKIINNRVVNFKGIRIGGLEYFIDTNWVKDFTPKDKDKMVRAKKETLKAKNHLKHFKDVDILLCHQPPYRVLDKKGPGGPKGWQGKHAGSKVILDYVKKKQPKLVLCGHMHEAMGRKKISKTEVVNLGAMGGYAVFEFD